MVVPLGPGKFYGRSLPRPRIYNDVKFNSDRVDPPVPVLDPFLSWANEAHWSMGGLSFKRLRLQGRIEGKVNKLRAEREKLAKRQGKVTIAVNDPAPHASNGKTEKISKRAASASVSPPPAPIATKRRRFMDLFDDDSEPEGEPRQIVKKETADARRRPARKLGDDFDRVAKENAVDRTETSKNVGIRTRSKRMEDSGVGEEVMRVVDEVNGLTDKGKKGNSSDRAVTVSGIRASPRLAKKASN